MRAVFALLGLVGLVAAGFMLTRAIFPPEPGTTTGQNEQEASRQPRRAKVTVSRARRADRRVTPYVTLLPAPVVAARPEPVPQATKKSQPPVIQPSPAREPPPSVQGDDRLPTPQEPWQAAQPSAQDVPASADRTVRIVPVPPAEAARQSTPAPVPPPAQEPAGQALAQKKSQPSDTPSTGPKAEDKSRPRFRLPYAKATQPLPEDKPQQAARSVKGESSRFRRAIPESPGVLKTVTRKIHLAGLDALAHDANCQLPSGQTWPCGRIGTLSLRRLIRSRSIVCDILEHRDETSVLARCKVANVDINRWVIRNGWARPAEGSPAEFSDALEAARREKKGQWREVSSVTN